MIRVSCVTLQATHYTENSIEIRVYTIQIPQLAKITTLSPDWWRSLNEKRGLLFVRIEREGNTKDTQRYA